MDATATEGLSVVNGQIRVTADGTVTLTDGETTIVITIVNYTRLLADAVQGEGVSIDVLEGEVPAGSKVTYTERSEDETAELAEAYEIENAAGAFDVSIAMPEGDVYTGEGQFKVTVDAPEVPEGGKLNLFHIHDGEAKEIESEIVDGKLTFVTPSFSDFVYTVDFEYTDPETGKKTAWSLPGRGSYAIADILGFIGIEGEITDVELKRTEDKGGSEWALYLNDEKTALVSEEAFKDTFELAVTVGDVKHVFVVTDADSETANIGNFITLAEISGSSSNGSASTVDGTWYISDPNGSYNIHLQFREVGTNQFPQLSDPTSGKLILTYDLPAGIQVAAQNGQMTFTHEGWNKTCTIPWTLTSDGKITMEIDNTNKIYTTDQGVECTAYDMYNAVTNGKIDFKFTGKWSTTYNKITFSSTVNVDVKQQTPPKGEVKLSKRSQFDESTKRIHYWVVGESSGGDVDTASIVDTLTGNGITMDPSTFTAKVYTEGDANIGTVSFTNGNKQYTLPVTDWKSGKQVVIEYYANIDYATLDTDDDGTVTFSADNTVSDGTTSVPNHIEGTKQYTWVDKSAGAASSVVQVGDKYYRDIVWTLKVNESQLGNMSNHVISDYIKTTTPPTTLHGSGITIKTTKNGTTTTTEVPWNSLTSKTDTSWSYTCPNNAGNTAYEITYTTRTEVTNLEDPAKIVNHLDDDHYGYREGEGTVGPVEEYGVQKDFDKINQDGNAEWIVTLTVPSTGLSRAQVEEWAPGYNAGGKVYNDHVVSYEVLTALAPGEHCEKTSQTDTSIVLNFYKDAGTAHPGLTGTGAQREIKIKFVTSVDSAWRADSTVSSVHQNKAVFNNKYDTAEKTFPNESISKTVTKTDWPDFTTYNGKKYKVLKYSIELHGVQEAPVTVTDSMDVDGVIYMTDTYLDGTDPGVNVYDNLSIYSGDWPNPTEIRNGDKATIATNGNGATFTITGDNLSKKPDGDNYAVYLLRYYVLVPFDAMQAKAALDADLIGRVNNTAVWNGHTITSTFENKYDNLDKQLINLNQLSNSNRIAQFRIRVNQSGAQVNGGVPYKLEDTFSDNLAVDYSSITFDHPEKVLSYEITGNTITFWVMDGTPLTINYNAKVMGEGRLNIQNTVTTEWESEEYKTEKEFNAEASAGGSEILLHLMKVDNDNAKVRFEGVQFKLDTDDSIAKAALGNDPAQYTFTTDADGKVDIRKDASHNITLYFNTEYRLIEVPETVPEGYVIGFVPTFYIDQDNQVNWEQHHYYNGYTMQVKNTRKKGNLDVVKTVVSEDDADKTTREYSFNITLYKDDARTQVATDVTGTFGDAVITQGTGTFKIVGQNTAHITGIPENLFYVVQEIAEADMAVTYNGVAKESETGKIVYNELKTIPVTNTKVNLDALNVVKSWEPEPDAEALNGLSVQVSLLRRAKNAAAGTAVEAVAEATTLTLDNAGNWRNAWDQLALDNQSYDYYILETTTPANTGYEASYYQNNVQLTETAQNASGATVYKIDVTVKPIVVNISNRKSELTIHKTVEGIDDITEEDKAKITFQVKDDQDQVVPVKVGNETKETFTYADFTEGIFKITDGLVNGKTYTVVETNAITGKVWVAKVEAVEQTPVENQVSGQVAITDYQGEVHFDNTYIDNTEIEVEKKWAGDVTTGQATMVLYKSHTAPTDQFAVAFRANIDSNHRPVDSAYINILQNGSVVATLSNANGWTSEVTGLMRGQAYDFTYQVDGTKVKGLDHTSDEGIETATTINLTPTIVEAQKFNYTFTVSGADSSTKGSITVDCGSETAVLNAADGWSHTFTGLVEETQISYAATTDGKFITAVSMNPVDATTVDSNETITLTPTFAPTTMNVPVSVSWESTPDAGTTVTVTFTNGAATETYQLSNPWSGSKSLPRIDSQTGDPLVWTVTASVTSPEDNATVTVGSASVSDPDGDGTATAAMINGEVQRDMNLTVTTNFGVNIGGFYRAIMVNGILSYNASTDSAGTVSGYGSTTNILGLPIKDDSNNELYYVFVLYSAAAEITTNATVAGHGTAKESGTTDRTVVYLRAQGGNVILDLKDSRDWKVEKGVDMSAANNTLSKAAPKSLRMTAKPMTVNSAPLRGASAGTTFADQSVGGNGTPFTAIHYKDLPTDAEAVDGEEEKTINGSGIASWDNLPKTEKDGTPIYYYVVEKEATAEAQEMSVSYEYAYIDGDPAKGIQKVTITNTTKLLTSDLEVTKNLSKVNTSGHDLTFYVGVFTDSQGTALADPAKVGGTNPKAVTIPNNGTSGTVTFTGLNIGTTYYVFETLSNGTKVSTSDKNNGYAITAGDLSGKAVTIASDNNKASVTNDYDAAETITFEGVKEIENRKFKAGDTLTVSITTSDGGRLPNPSSQTVSLTAGQNTANFSFAEVTYTYADIADSSATPKSKTFHYTVTETANMAGTTPDSRTHTVEVTVKDNGNGTLDVTKVYKAGSDTQNKTHFVNTYSATATFAPKAQKVFTHGTITDNQFTFVLTEVANATATSGTVKGRVSVSNGDAVRFNAFSYALADLGGNSSKTFYYTVAEAMPAGATEANNYTVDGIRYDTTVHRIEVTLTDNGTGTLQKAIKLDGASVEEANVVAQFTNEQLGKIKVTKEIRKNGSPDQSATGTFKVGLFEMTEHDGVWTVADTPAATADIEVTANDTGSVEFENLTIGKKYAVYEMVGDTILENGAHSGVYTVSYNNNTELTVAVNTTPEAKVVNNRELIDIPVTKIWSGNVPPAEGDYVKITLYKGDETTAYAQSGLINPITLQKTGDDATNWKGIFESLPKYENGSAITWKLVETEVRLNGNVINNDAVIKTVYSVADVNITSDSESLSADFTNTVGAKAYTVEKSWGNGQQPPQGASIRIKLTAQSNNTAISDEDLARLMGGSIEAILDGNLNTPTDASNGDRETAWKYTWTNLPKYDANYHEISYGATEIEYRIGTDTVDLTAYPAIAADQDNLTIFTNQIPKTEISVTKTWNDVSVDRANEIPEGASATLGLYTLADSTETPYPDAEHKLTVILNGTAGTDPATTDAYGYAEEAWKATWKNLPKYDAYGNQITYVVKEESTEPAGLTFKTVYDANDAATRAADGQNIENQYTSFRVQKRWMSNGTTWNPDYPVETIYYKLAKIHGTDTSSIQVIDGTARTLTASTTINVATANLGDVEALVKEKYPDTDNDGLYTIPFADQISPLPILESGWSYCAVECKSDGTPFTTGTQFWTCNEFNNTVFAIKNDLTDVTAQKIWDDKGNTVVHPAVTFSLYRTTETVSQWSNESGYTAPADWGNAVNTATILANATGDALTVKWTDLPKYDLATGLLYTYKVEETVPDGYTLKARGLVGGNVYNFSFENELQTTDLTVEKKWKINGENATEDELKTVPTITYQVWREAYTDSAMTAKVENSAENITDALKARTTDDRITGQLPIVTTTGEAPNQTTDYAWTEAVRNLPTTGQRAVVNGSETTYSTVYYKYYIVEEAGDLYLGQTVTEPTGDNYVINNELTRIRVTKKWKLNGVDVPSTELPQGSDGTEIRSITFTLHQYDPVTKESKVYTGDPAHNDGQYTITVTESGEGSGKTYTWETLEIKWLPRYASETQKYEYYIIEDDISGYSPTVTKIDGTTPVNSAQRIEDGEIIITNSKYTVQLPSTGGVGIGVIYGAGAALILLAVLGLLLNARRRVRDGID